MSPLKSQLGAVATAVLALAPFALACSSDQPQPDGGRPTSSVSPTAPPATPSSTADAGKQTAQLLMHPPLAQPGRTPQSPDGAESSMTGVFTPALEGREVLLQKQSGEQWVTTGSSEESDQGLAEFNGPTTAAGGGALRYRVVASEQGELPAVGSDAASTDEFGAPDFTDEFSGTSLGSAWADRLQGYSAESGRTCSESDPRAVQVGGGTVRLSVLSDPDQAAKCTYEGKQYDYRLNGHIGTEGAQSFTYGYAAARIKFQKERGQHGAFWMQPASREAEEGDAKLTGAEIDVIEWFGENQPQGGLTSFAYHYPDDGAEGVTGEKVGGFLKHPDQYGADWADKYHVFSVEWTPESYIFRIDGHETFRTSEGVSGQPEYLILSLLSSDYELANLDEDKLPQAMSVDWVRYWEM